MNTMKKSIFDYEDYRKYLVHALQDRQEAGARSRLAEALHCQPAFISRVLNNKDAHFSLEHGISINQFFGHSDQEAHYFMLLLQYGRAGSKQLENYYLGQMREVQEKRLVIADRLQVKQTLSSEDQMTYYSAWYYSAVHMAVMVPELQTKTALATYFKLPLPLMTECLDFLESVGFVDLKDGKYKIGAQRLHLPEASPLISKHHTNWRMKAIQSFDRKSKEDLFYSGPMSISEEDARKIRERILALLEEIEPVIKASKEEGLFAMNLDLFRV
jgi:uncharacterized protein (TIGR02147 family)